MADGAAPWRTRPVRYASRLETRPTSAIDLLVVHCTELPDLAAARDYAERIHYPDSATGNCGHYYLDRDGSVEQWVPDERIAHHVRGYNERSIGIELVNLGRYPDWLRSDAQMSEAYPPVQVTALLRLVTALRSRLPGLTGIAGHEDLDLECVPASDDASLKVARKRDPGPLFPWAEVMDEAGLERVKPQGGS